MSAEIRAARPDEWPEVRDLRLRALESSPDAFGSTIEREREYGRSEWLEWINGWEGSENRLFLALEGDTRLGLAVGSREHGRDHVHLYAMWVEPASRRRALGTGLVQAVMDWSAECGAAAVELGVTETNAGARAFYARNGFEDTGERYSLREGSPLSVIVMRRRLVEPGRVVP